MWLMIDRLIDRSNERAEALIIFVKKGSHGQPRTLVAHVDSIIDDTYHRSEAKQGASVCVNRCFFFTGTT